MSRRYTGTSCPRTPFTVYFQARTCTSRPSMVTVLRASTGSSTCLGRPVHGRLGLLPGRVQVLLEVALPVQQRDGDQRHAEVGRRPQRVAGEHAESTAVGGDRLLQADLHREIRDGGSRGGQRHLGLMLVSRDGGQALLAERGRHVRGVTSW